jgi:hypothetical protein
MSRECRTSGVSSRHVLADVTAVGLVNGVIGVMVEGSRTHVAQRRCVA